MPGAELWTHYHTTFRAWEPDSFILLQIFRGVLLLLNEYTRKVLKTWTEARYQFISFLFWMELGNCCCCCCCKYSEVRALTKCPFLQASIGQLESEHWLAHCITSALRSARGTGLFQTVWKGSIIRKEVTIVAVLAHPYLFFYPQRGPAIQKISGLGISFPDKHPVLAVADAHQTRKLNFELGLAPEILCILLLLSMSTDISECSKV